VYIRWRGGRVVMGVYRGAGGMSQGGSREGNIIGWRYTIWGSRISSGNPEIVFGS
jgi:hypothetical protein